MNYRKLVRSYTYLVTGTAGFIGHSLAKRLLDEGCCVVGMDSLNGYYDVGLKLDRLAILKDYKKFCFYRGDIADKAAVEELFEVHKPKIVVNLAAQAGVRYSIEHPEEYIKANINGFFNILDACRRHPVEHLVYASSSSVYGANRKVPFTTEDQVDNPVSLYAATKKSNELMAHAYAQIYGISVTGLRFFTVYGPMGRPDMAYSIFAKKILEGSAIQVFNNGNMYRDFTYIDDVTEAMTRILCTPPEAQEDRGSLTAGIRYAVYNIGNSHPEKLTDFIAALENALSSAAGMKYRAKKELLPLQPGDVKTTYADVGPLRERFGFAPATDIMTGLQAFADWYCTYYGIAGKEDIKRAVHQ